MAEPVAANEQVRFFQKELAGLTPGRPCEVCGMEMREHEWADLDENGFVFNCDISEDLKK